MLPLLILFVLVLLSLSSGNAYLSCESQEVIGAGDITAPHLARQWIFRDNLLIYQRGANMYARKYLNFDYANSPEIDFGVGEIVGVSNDFQSWVAVYFRSAGSIYAKFFDANGVYMTQALVFSSAEADTDLMFGSYFDSNVGHLAFASTKSDALGNFTFSMKRTGSNFVSLTQFQSVIWDSNATFSGILRAQTVDETGQMFLVLQLKDGTHVSETYKTNAQETQFVQTKVQPGFVVPVLAGHTVRATGSAAEGVFIVITSIEVGSVTVFHNLHTTNYGRSWVTSYEIFSVDKMNMQSTSFLSIVWLDQWFLTVDTFDGVIGLTVKSVQPFVFDWAEAFSSRISLFRPNDTVAYLSPRTGNRFTLVGQSRNASLGETADMLRRYSCEVSDSRAFTSLRPSLAVDGGVVCLLLALVLL